MLLFVRMHEGKRVLSREEELPDWLIVGCTLKTLCLPFLKCGTTTLSMSPRQSGQCNSSQTSYVKKAMFFKYFLPGRLAAIFDYPGSIQFCYTQYIIFLNDLPDKNVVIDTNCSYPLKLRNCESCESFLLFKSAVVQNLMRLGRKMIWI